MKYLFLLSIFSISINVVAQSSDSTLIHRTALDYIEGFYEGDTIKLKRCLSPTLYKYGYWKSKSGEYSGEQMTYAQAIEYGKGVLAKKQFAKPEAPKEVFLLDIQSNVACVKVHAWWGLDYVLLAKKGGAWIIDQVLWQGPLKTVKR